MYHAPIAEILDMILSTGEQETSPSQKSALSPDLIKAILTEAGKFTTERIVPLRAKGDRDGAKLDNGTVITSPDWRELYRDWIAGGWNSLTGSAEYGGQNLPMILSVAVSEIWNSGSLAFAIAPTLTMGAVETLQTHASPILREQYLARLISGEWMGTMNLTEPVAGSDLSALRARAERHEDGTYRIFGQKIFITYGEHDLSENIIHLVLARLPDAPEGTKGISLFLVPKFLVNPDGSTGRRNDVFCSGLEHKMGIHASPTCTMIYGDGYVENEEAGAIGYLVGEENRGLACMFTMINNARLLVGIQGVGVAEAAYQKALHYARERRQGRASSTKSKTEMSLIIEHPDVQRMLLTMKALTQAARSIAYSCAHAIDRSHTAADDARMFWSERAGLLTPLAKSFATDVGIEVASLGIQVHGGTGYIEETGAAQLLRDARITAIYEGTNGIQAIDLVMRKLAIKNGESIDIYLSELQEIADEVMQSGIIELGETGVRLAKAIKETSEATQWLRDRLVAKQTDEVLAGATPYLRLLSLTSGGANLAKSALSNNKPHHRNLCRFYAENILNEVGALSDRVQHGAPSLIAAQAMPGAYEQ